MTLKSIKLAGLLTAALVAPLALSTPAAANRDLIRAASQSESVQSRVREMRDNRQARRASSTLDRLLMWNEIMQQANVLDHTPNTGADDQRGPTRNSRAFAIVSIAVYDAVNSFDRRFNAFSTGISAAPNGASQDAAIAQAAFTTLVALHPDQTARLTGLFNSDLAQIRGSAASIAAGRQVGLNAANAILTDRATDRSQHTELNFGQGGLVSGGSSTGFAGAVNGGQLGAPNWTPDPVGRARDANGNQVIRMVALGSRWGNVKPFVLTSGAQFRIPPFPATNTARFRAGFQEVATRGADITVAGSTNSAADRFIGNFWGYDGAALLGTPPRLYNQIANVIADNEGLRRVDDYARLLAIVNTTMGDSGIAAWDSKYFYNYWRPVGGLRQANGTDNDPTTTADANWKPFGASVVNAAESDIFTPPFPAYPSGHATFGAALFQSLTAFFGNNTRFTFTSDEYDGRAVDPKGVTGTAPVVSIRPLVPVRYRTLRQAQLENGDSRIANGVHWEWDDTDGQNLGTNIVRFTLANKFQRR
jgi:membrane-associated phospholipid phosphatase